MLTRRNFLIATMSTAAVLAGCSSEPAPESQVQDEATSADGSVAVSGPTGDTPEGNASTASTLVVYFSATGTTQGVAEEIAAHTGADLFVITPSVAYTDIDLNYNDSGSRTSIERAEGTLPELAQMTPDPFDEYDIVYLGYPIWWGDAAWPVKTFASANDFSGKTVVPFCTSASSGIGSSADELASMTGTGTWVAGERFGSGTPTADIDAWVDSLEL